MVRSNPSTWVLWTAGRNGIKVDDLKPSRSAQALLTINLLLTISFGSRVIYREWQRLHPRDEGMRVLIPDTGWTQPQWRSFDRRMSETINPFSDKYFCLDEKTCGILGVRGEH